MIRRSDFLYGLLAVIGLTIAIAAAAAGGAVYSQPHDGSNKLYLSSWWNPDGSDWDTYTWDNFTLSSDTAITEIRWRGGLTYGGYYSGPVTRFTVEFFPSIAVNTEPDVSHAPLVSYDTPDNAGETLAGVFGGVTMYDYAYTLPAPFQASTNTKYWVHIYGWNSKAPPEWSFASSSSGDYSYFRKINDGTWYQFAPGNLCFTLISDAASTCPADLDQSGIVDLTDLATLLANYGTGATASQGDLNGDGTVDLVDLAGLLAVYGTICP